MDTSLSYLENIEITNETQLTFQKHKVQELITKQISLEYGVSDIMTILTLLIALGAMMVSLVANRISSLTNNFGIDTISLIIAGVILLGCLYYGVSGHFKQKDDQESIQRQITQTMSAISSYNECKNKKIAGDQK